jgi:hypothetical protein
MLERVKCGSRFNRASQPLQQLSHCNHTNPKIPPPQLTSTTDISTTMAPIDDAVAWLEAQEKANCAAAAIKFNLDRTTVWRHWNKISLSKAEATSIHYKLLTTAQEHEIIAYINRMADRGMPPTLSILRNIIREVVKGPVGHCYSYRFIQRYKDIIKSIYLRPIDHSRKIADNGAYFQHFFDTVYHLLFFSLNKTTFQSLIIV